MFDHFNEKHETRAKNPIEEYWMDNNLQRPSIEGYFEVIYSDDKIGCELFDGMKWVVEYHKPVKKWLFSV